MIKGMTMKDKIAVTISIITFLVTVAGYGVTLGRVMQRLEVVESKQVKMENVVDNKLDELSKSLSELSIQTSVQTAVLTEKVDSIKKELGK